MQSAHDIVSAHGARTSRSDPFAIRFRAPPSRPSKSRLRSARCAPPPRLPFSVSRSSPPAPRRARRETPRRTRPSARASRWRPPASTALRRASAGRAVGQAPSATRPLACASSPDRARRRPPNARRPWCRPPAKALATNTWFRPPKLRSARAHRARPATRGHASARSTAAPPSAIERIDGARCSTSLLARLSCAPSVRVCMDAPRKILK